MTGHRWAAAAPSQELGAVAHGPLLLARVGSDTDGIAVGARCVIAHPTGLLVPVVLMASGVYAEAARRLRFPSDQSVADNWSGLVVTAQLDGLAGEVLPQAEQSSAGDEAYQQETNYWIGALPEDETLLLTVAWPRIGLPQTTTTVDLPGLHHTATQTIALLTGPDRPAD
jgi:hypothetical protein